MADTAGRILDSGGVARLYEEELEGLPKQSSDPLVVVFVAEWCEVSRDEAPVFVKLAERFRGRVRFGFADVDANAGAAGRLGVNSVPAALVFARERELERNVGAASEEKLADLLEKALEECAKIEEAKRPDDKS